MDDTAFEEQTVDALGMLQRFGECMARRRVELQGRVAELEIEIDQHYAALQHLGEVPGGGGCNHGRAGAAADAERDDELAGTRAGHVRRASEHAVERAFQRIGGERLEEILDDADRLQIAVEPDVVGVADEHHARLRLAHGGERIGPRRRILYSRDIGDKQPRRRAMGKLADGSVDVAEREFGSGDADIAQRATQHPLRIAVAHENQRILRRSARDQRGGHGLGFHHCPPLDPPGMTIVGPATELLLNGLILPCS